MLFQIRKKITDFSKDTEGSESIEVLYSIIALCALFMVSFMILSYALEVNNVNFANRHVVRTIEVTGQATNIESTFQNALGNSELITNRQISISDVTYKNPLTKTIQLKNTFRVTASVDYIIPLINPGSLNGVNIKLPIKTSVTGMSEVYWS